MRDSREFYIRVIIATTTQIDKTEIESPFSYKLKEREQVRQPRPTFLVLCNILYSFLAKLDAATL
jgi:hypothetical protein